MIRRFKEFILSLPGGPKAALIFKHPFELRKYGTWPNFFYSPPGHHDSAIPNLKYVYSKRESIFDRTPEICESIDLRVHSQLELLDRFSEYYDELPFAEKPSDAGRFYLDNYFFSYGDAIFLYSFMRHFRPKRIIEIGSGFSSALMLDVNDRFFKDDPIRLVFIDPYPDRLKSLLKDDDHANCIVMENIIQDVEINPFLELDKNDILFVDSSHIAKTGGDVPHIFFKILPVLKPGVLIHVHDIFWPFEYPQHWVFEGRAWNEAYLLRAFLQYNNAFEIMCFNDFIARRHPAKLVEKMPLALKNTSNGNTSIWLRKTK